MASFKFRDQKAPKTRLFTCPGSPARDLAPAAPTPGAQYDAEPATTADQRPGRAILTSSVVKTFGQPSLVHQWLTAHTGNPGKTVGNGMR
jgi:hypothetical protein